MKFSQVAVAAALTGLSLAASATTFTKSVYHFGDEVNVVFNSVSSKLLTAEIIGTFNPAPAGSFAAFCVEIDQEFASPFTGAFKTPEQAAALGQLIAGAGWKSGAWASDAIASDDKASIAALQVGIWDIVYDGSIDLASGTFKTDAAGQAAYGATLAAWMEAGKGSLLGKDLLVLSDGHGTPGEHQDILIAVPEPSTYALMIAGLGAVGFVARRRARRG